MNVAGGRFSKLTTMPVFGRGRSKIEIKNGSIKNGEIYFEIERGPAENKVITRYTEKQTGDKIKGTIETTVDGEERKSRLGPKAGGLISLRRSGETALGA